jgi:cysteine-rich repeat protein
MQVRRGLQMTNTWQYLRSGLVCAFLWTNASCDLDTETQLCSSSGRRCPTGWSCAASQDVCISDGCGDGIIDDSSGEICDDGNIFDGDGCSADCLSTDTCGDGEIGIDEACDDGNDVSGDGCSSDCLSDETCGNGYHDVNEACDDGNNDSSDGCSADCLFIETCGDGQRDVDEVCDDGNNESGDGCSFDCLSIEVCGNSYADVNEECDVGLIDDASCDADCTLPVCGDGHHNPEFINPMTGGPEYCDDGGESVECDADCTPSACGDGHVNTVAGESCDDGNLVSGDGCSDACAFE